MNGFELRISGLGSDHSAILPRPLPYVGKVTLCMQLSHGLNVNNSHDHLSKVYILITSLNMHIFSCFMVQLASSFFFLPVSAIRFLLFTSLAS